MRRRWPVGVDVWAKDRKGDAVRLSQARSHQTGAIPPRLLPTHCCVLPTASHTTHSEYVCRFYKAICYRWPCLLLALSLSPVGHRYYHIAPLTIALLLSVPKLWSQPLRSPLEPLPPLAGD